MHNLLNPNPKYLQKKTWLCQIGNKTQSVQQKIFYQQSKCPKLQKVMNNDSDMNETSKIEFKVRKGSVTSSNNPGVMILILSMIFLIPTPANSCSCESGSQVGISTTTSGTQYNCTGQCTTITGCTSQPVYWGTYPLPSWSTVTPTSGTDIDIYKCVSCPSNCNQCINNMACTICQWGYLLNSGSCVLCSNSISNCNSCTSAGVCTSCVYGYALDYRNNPTHPTCFHCGSLNDCLSCSSGPICQYCGNGRLPNYNNPLHECLSTCPFSNCYSCGLSGTDPVCNSCNSGYVFDLSITPKQCVLCASKIAYCNYCSDGPSCQSCNYPYVLNNSQTYKTCVSCSSIPNCQFCTNGPSCTYCYSPFVLDSSGTYGVCVPCSNIANCDTCNDGPICTKCLSPYVLDTSASPPTCVLCNVIANCDTCIDGPVCTLCNSGYAFDTSITPPVCILCSSITDCGGCTDGPVCTSCLTTNWVRDLTTTNKRCVDCLSIIADCVTCVDGPKCSACSPNFYLNYNNYNKTCVQCSYISNCDTCINGPVCTKCLNNYFLNFNTGNKTCASCPFFKCSQCTDGPRCIQCEPGYFLNTTQNLCMPCYFPCATCDVSATSCTSCPTGQLYFYDPNTKNCSLCYHNLTDCQSCNLAGTECLQCNSSLVFLDPSTKTCLPCTNNCLNCQSDLQCIDCVNTNFALDSVTKECKLCDSYMPRCLTCLSHSACTTCNDTMYFLTYPPNQCLKCQEARPNCAVCVSTTGVGPTCTQCDNKFYRQGFGCNHCPAPCALCTSLTSCSSCVNVRYTVVSGMCTLCSQLIPNCLECSSPTTCTYCVNSTGQDPNGSGSCVPCGTFQYPDEANQLCTDCQSPCQTCLNSTECLTCRQFFEYVPAVKGCKDICGDEVVMADTCDNGIGVINDGCSDKCTQDPDFTCKNFTATVQGQSVKKSVCSYNSKVDIKLLEIRKEPFKNTMACKYRVTPYLYGLPGTNSRQFILQQLKDTFLIRERPPASSTASDSKISNTSKNSEIPQNLIPGVKVGTTASPSLTVENVEVDAAQSTVTVTMNYEADLKNSDLELFIDFTYLRTSLGLPHFDTTQDSDKVYAVSSYRSNSMIGQFYTQDQYASANLLNKLSLAIGLMSFFAFLIGIFTKEVVGLEMAMLCQFVYLSLFYFEGTIELPFFALKSLVYSTGYNIAFEGTYEQLSVDPPQSLTLGYDATTFSNNFNVMTVLYILPLVIVIPFIPLKAKCIRKLSMIELGHKWVDLLLGEIYLYGVLFNFQFFLFSLVVFYRDGRNTLNYASCMICWFGAFCTLCSFLGLVFKPEIYGNFRTAFKYNSELRAEVMQDKQKMADQEEKLTKKFEGGGRGACWKGFVRWFRLFMNENYFWRNWRSFHTALTYNHYTLLVVFYTLTTLSLTLIKSSELIILILTSILLLEVILLRPYGKVFQKVRAIYFSLVYVVVAVVRFIKNQQSTKGQDNLILSGLIVMMLVAALVWTYVSLTRYFVKFVTQRMSNRNNLIAKVFNNNVTDNFDKDAVAQEEETLMRKLMKRYERVELQYNLNNARNQLISGYDSIDGQKSYYPLNNDNGENKFKKPFSETKQKQKEDLFTKQLLKKVEQEQNYKNLKQIVQKQKNKKRRELMKKTVTGDKMLKLLKLDNFNKYEQEYFASDDEKKQFNEHQENYPQAKQHNNRGLSIQIPDQQEGRKSESEDLDKDDYESVEPQNIDEAKFKLEQQKILMEQNHFIRYKRAAKIIASQGLTLDYDLIERNYDYI